MQQLFYEITDPLLEWQGYLKWRPFKAYVLNATMQQ